jgi:hypothetical protein
MSATGFRVTLGTLLDLQRFLAIATGCAP